MKPYKEDEFAFFVSRELINARSKGELGFEIHQLITVGSVAYKPQPTIVISPGHDLRKIVATCFAKKGEVYVSHSQSYFKEANNVVDVMNRRAENSVSQINPYPPYHFQLSEIIL